MLSVSSLKYLASILILLITILSGIITFCMGKKALFQDGGRLISLGNSATAGIFVCMGFSHIFFEASEDAEKLTGFWEGRNPHIHVFLITYILILTLESLGSKENHEFHAHSQDSCIEMDVVCKNKSQIHKMENGPSEKGNLAEPLLQKKPTPVELKQKEIGFYVLLFALSFHSFSTGLAMGVQEEYYSVLAIMIGTIELFSYLVSQINRVYRALL